MKKLLLISFVAVALVAFATVAQAQIGLTNYYGDGDLYLTDGGAATELRLAELTGVNARNLTAGYTLHVGSARSGKVDGTIMLYGADGDYAMFFTDWDDSAKFAGSAGRDLTVAMDSYTCGLKIHEGNSGATPLLISEGWNVAIADYDWMDVRARVQALEADTHTNIWTAIENIEIALAQKGASGSARYINP